MRFSIKIFICTVLIVALAFPAGGYLLISSNFTTALKSEISRALEEHLSLRYMFESGVISEEMQGYGPTDEMLARVADGITETLRRTAAQSPGNIVISAQSGRTIYSDAPAGTERELTLKPLKAGQVNYQIRNDAGTYKVYISGLFSFDGVPLFLSYVRNITPIFAARNLQLKKFMLYDVAIVVSSAVVVLLFTWLLTRPVRKLTAASRRIAGGEYGVRSDVHSSDEIGLLTESFNTMAGAVEEKICELELASRRKDEFIANFTHELKTPMTSIIGYADMLRSKECDAPTVFKAASYIFNEGKRLESLSLKMLDLLLLENQAFTLRPVNTAELLEYISESMAPAFRESGVALAVEADDGTVRAEPDFIKTLLINLADNARKASPSGSTVELSGRAEGGDYQFSVKDHGRGIPEKELSRITEAFYMVDKARDRAKHGAGLGLAIASRIAELHGARLDIRSIVGLGTCVSFSLPLFVLEKGAADDEE